MNEVATQRPSRTLLPDLTDLLDSLPALQMLRPLIDIRATRAIRVEDELHDDLYEIRAELPGVDPDEDIEVTVRDGRVTISAERSRPGEACGRSEFAYGSFTRTLPLPDGADEDDVNAVYDRGILTVLVPLSDEYRVERHVEIVEVVALESGDEHDDDDDEDTDDDYDDESDDDDDSDDDSHGDGSVNGSVEAADLQEHSHQG